MKNLLITISLLALATGSNDACFKSNVKVSPEGNPRAVEILIPTQYEKRTDGTYWDFHPSRGWYQTGHVQFYEALKGKRMSTTIGADGQTVYKIGKYIVNQDSFNWVKEQRKANKQACCVIS